MNCNIQKQYIEICGLFEELQENKRSIEKLKEEQEKIRIKYEAKTNMLNKNLQKFKDDESSEINENLIEIYEHLKKLN